MFSAKNLFRVHWDQLAPWEILLCASGSAFGLASAQFLWAVFTTKGPDHVSTVPVWLMDMLITVGWALWIYAAFRLRKWLRKHEDETRAVTMTFCAVALVGLVATMFVWLWSIDQTGEYRVEMFHAPQSAMRMSPLLCVDGAPTAGFVGALPERYTVSNPTINAVGICPSPLDQYAMKITAIWVDGVRYTDLEPLWTVTFNPPLYLEPGQRLFVVFEGFENEYYKHSVSPTYVVERSLRSYAEIMEALYNASKNEPGFVPLDWIRAGKGLIYRDSWTDPKSETTGVLYVSYADENSNQPRELTALSLKFCSKVYGNIRQKVGSGGWDDGKIEIVIPSGGRYLRIQAQSTGETLVTCEVGE